MPIASVILAAGRSRRLGEPKALVELDGERVLDRLVRVYAAANLDPVRVVVSDAIANEVPAPAVAVLSDPDREMIDSLIVGLTNLGDVAGAVVQPVDAPFTSGAMLDALVAEPGDRFRVLTHDGRPGHPVFVPAARFADVLNRPEGGLRRLLEHDLESIEWNDDLILADLDRPEDLRYWRSRS
ncbi:MAG: NTP transferase domain-containing protein [Deltaproteobacteria bacterium]